MNKLFNRHKTFKAEKKHPNHQSLRLSEHAKQTLGSGDMKAAVVLPPGEDLNEWLSVNTVDFYNEISLLYGAITEFCTPATCPEMKAGEKYEYLWMDGVTYKKPTKMSAPEYVDHLMSWVEQQLNDEALFPPESGSPFPKDFQKHVKTIFKRLFRVYAHIYHAHFEKFVSFSAEAHLNTCFKHFIFFVHEFQLVDAAELEPLKGLVSKWVGSEEEKKTP